MTWTAAAMEILSLDTVGTPIGSLVQSITVTQFTQFKATGRAFPITGANFIFVHAHDATGLKPFHVIPCENVTVKTLPGQNGLQEIEFQASLHERKAGAYHLLGWAPAEQGENGYLINQATTLENAFTLQAAPDAERDEKLQTEGLSSEPE